jgi:hypothetical protein
MLTKKNKNFPNRTEWVNEKVEVIFQFLLENIKYISKYKPNKSRINSYFQK